jgi:hypothetical protein
MRKVRIIGLGIAAAAAAGLVYQLPASPFDRDQSQPVAVETRQPVVRPSVTPAPSRARAKPRPITFPARGSAQYAVLPGHPATIGSSGRLLRFRVVVEGGITNLDRGELGRFARATYADRRGWTAGGRWRFRQVGPGEGYDYTLMLVTPATRDDLCGGGYDRYTSCRIKDKVVLNIARWVEGVPNYGASLETYRQYMINHETGHRLGHWHELCPSPGAPAPVMEQQTLGLHGCAANAWPYLNGERYRGRPGQYDDPLPST